MVHLDQQDLQRLVGILQQFSEFEDEKSRRSFLPLAGLGLLLPRMDLAGTPFIASIKIINFLGAYGRLPNGVEALGSLLDGIRVYMGIAEQNIIDEIAARYQLVSPSIQAEMPIERTGKTVIGPDSPPRHAALAIPQARKVFISYSSADRRWLDKLKTHLAPLEHQQIIEIWDDTRIMAGTQKEQTIDNVIGTSSIAILLISTNSLASEVITGQELPRILSRHVQGKMQIFPLILSSCLYQTSPLGRYTTFNDMDQPLSQLTPAKVDRVLANLARELERSI